MGQSNSIFFFLFAAFFVFITMRGELPKYMGFILASPKAGSGTGTATASAAPSIGSDVLSYNAANNSQSNVSQQIGSAAVTAAKIAAGF